MSIEAIKAQLSHIESQKRELERQIEALRQERLLALPEQVGLSSIDGLLVALIPYASPALRAKLEAVGIDREPVEPALSAERRVSRARFPADMRSAIKAELEAGGKSVVDLSREYGPSPGTIMNWKRQWHMTRGRAKPAPARR